MAFEMPLRHTILFVFHTHVTRITIFMVGRRYLTRFRHTTCFSLPRRYLRYQRSVTIFMLTAMLAALLWLRDAPALKIHAGYAMLRDMRCHYSHALLCGDEAACRHGDIDYAFRESVERHGAMALRRAINIEEELRTLR